MTKNEKLGSCPIDDDHIELPSFNTCMKLDKWGAKYHDRRIETIKTLSKECGHEDEDVRREWGCMVYESMENTQKKLCKESGLMVSFHCECSKCDNKTPNEIPLTSFLRTPHLYFQQPCSCGGTAYSTIDVSKLDELLEKIPKFFEHDLFSGEGKEMEGRFISLSSVAEKPSHSCVGCKA